MSSDAPHLSNRGARRHERATCHIVALAFPLGEGDGHVRASPARARADGGIPALIVDLSPAGLSLVTELFLPRGCEVDVSVSLPTRGETRLTGQVRNVVMIDRTPRYKIGLRLTGDQASRLPLVNELLARSEPGNADSSGAEVRRAGA